MLQKTIGYYVFGLIIWNQFVAINYLYDIKAALALLTKQVCKEGNPLFTPDRRKTLALFIKRSRDLPSKAVLRCMGSDLSAVVPVQFAARERFPAYV